MFLLWGKNSSSGGKIQKPSFMVDGYGTQRNTKTLKQAKSKIEDDGPKIEEPISWFERGYFVSLSATSYAMGSSAMHYFFTPDYVTLFSFWQFPFFFVVAFLKRGKFFPPVLGGGFFIQKRKIRIYLSFWCVV